MQPDDALAARLREVPSTVGAVWLHHSGAVRWDGDEGGGGGGEGEGEQRAAKRQCIDLCSEDDEAACLVVDESRRVWWAKQLVRVKREEEDE